jgi:DNA-binding IclR family transcriptional regulator
MLAFMPDGESEQICRSLGLPMQTENTIRTWPELHEDLCRTRARGYAVDEGENVAGLCCIGAPVFGIDDRVLGAISISFPANRFTPETYLPIVPRLKYACQDISGSLGAGRTAILKLAVEERSEDVQSASAAELSYP